MEGIRDHNEEKNYIMINILGTQYGQSVWN